MPNSIEVKMSITKASELKMEQAINYSAVVLRRSIKSTLQKTSVFFVQSASKLTPQSKKRRKFRKISEKKERILFSHGVRYRIWRYNRVINGFHWVYAKDENTKNKKALIEYRRIYKKIWKYMLPKLGRSNSAGLNKKAGAFARRSTRVADKSFLKTDPYIKLTYARPEMRRIAPGVIPHALNKAKRRLVGEMKNQMKRKLERAWGK
jgi:hypothetical protein